MTDIRINDIFTEWKTGGGVFSALLLEPAYNAPWAGVVGEQELDIAYHGLHSGQKLISPLIEVYLVNGELSQEDRKTIMRSVSAVYLSNWQKLWTALTADYNPIENYSMTEKGKDVRTNTGTQDNNKTFIHGHNMTEEHDMNRTVDNGVYGFDSSALSPESQNKQGDKGKVTTTNAGTDTDSNVRIDDLMETANHEFTRSGNIGVTSSQDMLLQEFEVRKHNYFEQVFADVDRMLALRIY